MTHVRKINAPTIVGNFQNGEGMLESELTHSLRRACRVYNDRPLRAMRAENPELLEDGVTVESGGDQYQPSSVRDMLGWLAAGQWDADGPDPSVGSDAECRPAHARLTSWWRRTSCDRLMKKA